MGVVAPFTGIPAIELRDRWVPVDDVWRRSLDRIRHQLGAAAPASETLRLVEEELRARGATPKQVARIYRFARLILSVDTRGPVDWPSLAHAVGYYDQAHLSREFKDFTGHTPTEYLALRRRLPAEQGYPPDSGPCRPSDFLQAPAPLGTKGSTRLDVRRDDRPRRIWWAP